MSYSCWPFKLTLDIEKFPFSDGAAEVRINLWLPLLAASSLLEPLDSLARVDT